MNQDTVKGTFDDVAGRARRQVGEWTGDAPRQAEGTAWQMRGKTQNARGSAKDEVQKANAGAGTEQDPHGQTRIRCRRDEA